MKIMVASLALRQLDANLLDLSLEQINEALREEIRRLQALLDEQPKPAPGIAGPHGALITPKEFAVLHRVSDATINRALNSHELLSERQSNGRWLVYADQPYQQKRKRE